MATKVTNPISANANSGPDSPTNGSTNSGASAGPTMVPRPKLLLSEDSAETRPDRRVLDARYAWVALGVAQPSADAQIFDSLFDLRAIGEFFFHVNVHIV